jgi:hypothetical protein
MKTVAIALALLLFVGSVSQAQMGGMGGGQALPAAPPEDKVQLDILELEQEVDKNLLKEALTTLGKEAMISPSEINAMPEEARKHRKADILALEEFIKAKKASLLSRSVEIAAVRDKPMKAMREQMKANQVKQATKPDRLAQLETMGMAQAEIQLLQKQVELYQQNLTSSIDELANAEFAAANDDRQKEAYDAAKKKYEKTKSKFVDFSKQLQAQQWTAFEMERQIGMGGMSGMGGMGGGMR